MVFYALFNKPRYYSRLYEQFYDEMDFHTDRETWRNAVDHIPEELIQLFALHWLHLEVHNGGFWQFFFNSTGVMAPEAKRGFDAIGMPGTARLIGRAMDHVGDPYVFDREERMKIVGMPDDRMNFDREDDIFYFLADTRKIFRRQPKFVPHAEAYANRLEARQKGPV